ncbi:peptidoglycan-binding protein [Allorhizobium sp. BGMRC 0089]|uniref:peptidoglycan-binding protein n=1 Tax=Allorhizobium sonneratiae TaxID=2934936 RepID=UPI0020338BB6|nr:peptidoglycan-binding protein [Allorhizobium sonneratiae]MCM2291477.1 peptidoglycan-binding protein [Allorhizobium sonneratiae]
MNGQRSPLPRNTGLSSIEALSRTIEGLEARIEGLMKTAKDNGRAVEPAISSPTPEPVVPAPRDLLSEIRERQKALEAARPRFAEGNEQSRREAPGAALAFSTGSAASSIAAAQDAASAAPDERQLADLYRALDSLRDDLKATLSQETKALKADIHALKADSGSVESLRADFDRLCDTMARLYRENAGQSVPETQALREDIDRLGGMIDALANRPEAQSETDERVFALETRFDSIAPERIQQELLQLAYRLDEINGKLATIGDARSVRLLEDKLIAIAHALEHIGQHLEPNSQAVLDHFAALDRRLEEMALTIAASSRHGHQSATDPALLERLDERMAVIAHHLELISEQTADRGWESELAARMATLSERVEDLASQQAAYNLEERLNELSALMERSRSNSLQPELTGVLSDMSRKIDALDHDSLGDRLAREISVIGRRIDEIDIPVPVSIDDGLLSRMDERLHAIAARLDEAAALPQADAVALAGLEQQIAHLSALISATPLGEGAHAGRLEGRMAALEDYVATSDDYIVEAARHAAETVMENFSRQTAATRSGHDTSETADMLATLAGHLTHLEEISRGSEERSHRTFEALHQTLVQIAEKLDQMDKRAAAQATVQTGAQTAAQPARTRMSPEAGASSSPVQAAHREIEAAFQETPDLLSEAPAVSDATADITPETLKPGMAVPDIKPSLLAGLARKLKGNTANVESPAVHKQRPMIDPSPSIDPADILPPEEANQLLEPGSGKPDVRKILETVRARKQSEGGQNDGRQGEGSKKIEGGKSSAPSASGEERMDIIAAARRAAQAAAQETERSGKTIRMPLASEVRVGSAFQRYRRPILLAVGALLLAALALPLVKALTAGPAQPPAAAIDMPAKAKPAEAKVDTAKPAQQSAETGKVPAAVEAVSKPPAPGVQTAPSLQQPVSATPGQPRPSAALTGQPLDGASRAANLAPAQAQVPTQPVESHELPAIQPAAATVAYDVPAAITPASLADAAHHGDPAAMYEVANRYIDGRGVPSDFAQAAIWYQRAADKGLVPAKYRLAGLYEKGTGVPRDIARAKSLYQQAADAGNASAMHNLAVLYASGEAGQPDMAKAAEWFTRAANLGIYDSQYNLAVLYARGTGVKQDLEASYKWFALAARKNADKGGDKDAADKRDEVGRTLKPEELQQAKSMVDTWKALPLDPDANTVNVPDAWQGQGIKTGSVDMEKAIRNIQAILNRNGFPTGEPDGKLGPRTVAAIKDFQKSVGLTPDGKVSNELVKALLAKNR